MKIVLSGATIFTLCFSLMICSIGTSNAQMNDKGIGEIVFHTKTIGSANFMDKNDKELKGEVGSFSAGVGLSLFKINVDYDYTAFSWDSVNFLPFGNGKDDPWEQFHSINIGMKHSDMFNKNWGYFMALGGSSQFEEQMDGSYGASGFAGVIYVIPDTNLTFLAGGGVSYDPLETNFLPMIGIKWNGSAKSGFAVSIGVPETYVSYRFSPTTAISLSLDMGEGGIYRLADKSTVEEEGYVEIESMGGKLAFTFSPFELCSVSIGAGASFNREYTIYDQNENEQNEYDLDDTYTGFFSVGFEF